MDEFISCPHCRAQLSSDLEAGEQLVACPHCRCHFEIQQTNVYSIALHTRSANTGRKRICPEAIRSFVFGLLGVICFPFGVLAVVLGFEALKRIRNPQKREYGASLAQSGIGLGTIGVLVSCVALALGALNGNLSSTSRKKVPRLTSAEAAKVKQQQWEAKLVRDREMQVTLDIVEGRERPLAEDIRHGLSEHARREFFTEWVRIEDQLGVNTSKSKAAKRAHCDLYGISHSDAIEIAVEANEENWPLPD